MATERPNITGTAPYPEGGIKGTPAPSTAGNPTGSAPYNTDPRGNTVEGSERITSENAARFHDPSPFPPGRPGPDDAAAQVDACRRGVPNISERDVLMQPTTEGNETPWRPTPGASEKK